MSWLEYYVKLPYELRISIISCSVFVSMVNKDRLLWLNVCFVR